MYLKIFRFLHVKMSHPGVSSELLRILAAHAAEADARSAWPAASWQTLRDGGVLGWCIPREHGGSGLRGSTLLAGYEQLASACLTTSFILSQREAACRRIRDLGDLSLRRELLPRLARGECFATVGLSHLTTSRQHTEPAVRIECQGETIRLEGTIPWVTGAAYADYLVTGGVLANGQPMLVVLPTGTPGVIVGEPLPLMALAGSLTAEVTCTNVVVERLWGLAEPAEPLPATKRPDSGGLETSCLALGLTRAAIDLLSREAQQRPELATTAGRLEMEYRQLRVELHGLADSESLPGSATRLRGEANELVLRATQAALTASKGTGFLLTHPAQRWARQALFFLVWSCPRPVVEAALTYFSPGEEEMCPAQ